MIHDKDFFARLKKDGMIKILENIDIICKKNSCVNFCTCRIAGVYPSEFMPEIYLKEHNGDGGSSFDVLCNKYIKDESIPPAPKTFGFGKAMKKAAKGIWVSRKDWFNTKIHREGQVVVYYTNLPPTPDDIYKIHVDDISAKDWYVVE